MPFCFTWNFAFRQIQGCWCYIRQQFLQIPVQKYPDTTILVPNIYFFFNIKFCNLKKSRLSISNTKTIFLKFLSKTQRFLILKETLPFDKLEDADFKCDKSFFKFQSKSTQIRQTFVSNFIFLT